MAEVEAQHAGNAREVLLDEIEDRELVVFVLALAAFLYAVAVVRRDARIREPRLILGALLALTLGLFATNLEALLDGRAALVANAVEHLCYVLHTAVLAAYIWRRTGRREAA